MQTLVSLHNIELAQSRSFTLAIHHLELRRGCIYTLSGPNGAGKSTLLQVLALLTTPEQGELCFDGETVSTEAQRQKLRRQITLVHQSPYLFAGNVEENLAFGLRLRGIRGEEQRESMASALDAVGLSGFAHRHVRELSGGEAQRVALARALALKPQLLLLDEPTANIDRRSLLEIENAIALLPGQGITVVAATHDHEQPARLAASVIPMADGRLAEAPGKSDPQTGPPFPMRISHAQL